MAVVRGDRIGESQSLNRCSIEAQEFYALFIASVPDDFGRYRHSPSHIAIKMYPRREPTPVLLKRVARLLAELEREGLVSTWQADDVLFGLVARWRARGNRYHRTPEPPETKHVHTGSCLSTAIHRAREWGLSEEAERLCLQLKEIRDRKAASRTRFSRFSSREGDSPSPPYPSVPSVPLRSVEQRPEQQQPSAAHAAAVDPPADDPLLGVLKPAEQPEGWLEETRERLTKGKPVAGDDVHRVFDHWRARLGHPDAKLTADRRKRVEARLREGYTADQLCEAIDGCASSPFHRGENDRGTPYDDLELICRSGSKVENFRRQARAPTGPPPRAAPARRPSVGDAQMVEAQKFLERGK